MASSGTTEKSFHVRSVSLPSQARPTALRVEEDLHKLKTCVESSASSLTAELIFDGYLANLYEGIEELLRLPSMQQGLLHFYQKKKLQEDVDGSMKLLEHCGIMKDAVIASKGHLQDLQVALRRRGEHSTGEKVQASIRTRKQMQKIIKKSYKDLKQVNGKCQSASPIHEDSELSATMRILNKARAITRSLLCSISQLIAVRKTRASWWSFSSKAMRVAYEDFFEAWKIDFLLSTDLKDADAEKVMMAHDQLKTTENSFGDLKNVLERLFGRLIQNKVSGIIVAQSDVRMRKVNLSESKKSPLAAEM